MRSFKGFLIQVGFVLITCAFLGGTPLYWYAGKTPLVGVAVGCLIATVNVLVGCFLSLWARPRSQATFLKAVFGGMTLRLAGMVAVFFGLIKFTEIHVFSLTLGLFFFYVVFQIMEIRFLAGSSSI